MHRAQRLGRRLAVDHHGDVPFRCALRDCPHIDRCAPERLEHLGRDAVHPGHAVADDCENAQSTADVDALNMSVAQFGVERTAHGLLGTHRLLLGDREANRMFGTSLRNQDHGDARIAQRAEQPVGRSRHADHAGALEIDERDRIDRGDALDLQRRGRMRANQRASLGRRERVADIDRDIARDRRLHRQRMNHLGAEIREFHRFVVGQLIDHFGIRHEPRIRGEHAVDIGPNMDFRRLQQGAENRPGIIAAVAPQSRVDPTRRGRNVAGDDQSTDEIRRDRILHVAFARRPLHRRPQRPPFDDYDLARVEPSDFARECALAREGRTRTAASTISPRSRR